MADHTLSILSVSVNNLPVRVLMRASGHDFEEVEMWGKKGTDEFLAKSPADLPRRSSTRGCPRGRFWESCAIMQYLCNRDGLNQFDPTDPAERAMQDSAMSTWSARSIP